MEVIDGSARVIYCAMEVALFVAIGGEIYSCAIWILDDLDWTSLVEPQEMEF